MAQRSLLNGQEDCVTFQMTMSKPFYAVSLVWNILRKYCAEETTQNIKGMRCFKDNTGAVFDVLASHVSRFEDIFEHETQRSTDFQVSRATTLPELKEDMNTGGGYGGGYGGGGGYDNRGSRNMHNHNYPSQRFQGNQDGRFQGGYQGGNQGGNYQLRSQGGGYQGGNQYGGGQSQGQSFGGGQRQQRDQSCSVFMGNLGDMDQRATTDMLNGMGLKPMSVRVLSDDTGRPKGAAFVDFANSGDYQNALKFDGQQAPNGSRKLRVNPAGARPGGR
jgi:RNA recognition motif-containing protein